MHNLYAIFAKFLNICKQVAGNLVNESGNVPRRGVVPKFSDLEIVALNMTSEVTGIDSESFICKQVAGNLVNESGNVPRRGVVPKFSDLEIVALNMTSEVTGIDSESLLFAKLQEYRNEIPNLISRRQYNDRRKITSSLCNRIRERMAAEIDGGEDYFCIDSKPIGTFSKCP